MRLRDLRGGWLDHPQADPNGWLGFHARAQDASPEAAADANRRRRPGSSHVGEDQMDEALLVVKRAGCLHMVY